MKKWEKHESSIEQATYNLVFGHRSKEPKEIVCLFRDHNGDWRTTSDLLETFWTPLVSGTVPVDDAKIFVEKMVFQHYENKMKYYQEICQEFGES